MQTLKISSHLQLLKNIGHVPCVVHGIFAPILYPGICIFQFPTPGSPVLRNHQFLNCIYGSASFLLYSLVCFFRFHIQVIICHICLSLSDLFHRVYALRGHPWCYKQQNFVLFMAEQYSICVLSVCVHTIFIHSFVDGRLVYFLILAIITSATVNNGVPVSLRISILGFWRIYPGVELWDLTVVLLLVF